MKNIFILIFLFSCSYTKYKAPSVVYRAPISPKLDPASKNFDADDYALIKNLSREIKPNGKLLVFYQNYDQFDYVSTPNVAESIEYGVDVFIKKLDAEKIFKKINMMSLSHVRVNSISDMIEVSKINGADYFILLSSSYNYYRYSNTLGYFLGWIPVINYFSPIHASYVEFFLQIEFFNVAGAGIFTESMLNERKENISTAYSSDHFARVNKELNHNTFIEAAIIVSKKYKESLKK